MDSLANYGSDDDYDDSEDEKKPDWRSSSKKSGCGPAKQEDANYEEVQMDLSEESNDSADYPARRRNSTEKESSSSSSSSKDRRQSREKEYRRRGGGRDEESSGSSRRREERDRKERDRDRDRYSRRRDDDHKSERDEYKRRDDRERHREDRDRRSRRSPSRERQRSRSRSKSPRRFEYRGGRERVAKPASYSSKKYEKASNKMAHLEKLGIEIKTPDCQYVTPSDLQKSMDDQRQEKTPTEKNRFFMPGITGRFRDQIEKRKLLWQKKEPEKRDVTVQKETVTSTSTARTTKVWETVNFAQDQDGKVASKFKRLMGIKGQAETGPSGTTDVLKKQEEMFSSMEQQYEVARTATHTMRGVGLGFGSFQR